jgi:membrane dipeptidase
MRWLLSLLLTGALAGQTRTVSEEEVRRVHGSALLIDSHNDVTSRTVAGWNIGPRAADGQTDLVRLREGGVGAVFFAAYVAASYAGKGQAAHRALEMIDTVRTDIVAAHPDGFVLARTAGEIEAARKAGKVAALIGIEGGHAIENSLRTLRDFFDLGVRYMTLTHANTNDWADSSGDIDKPGVKHHNGLTAFGKDVVREMNRLGMMVDISHVSDKTFWDALEVSEAPVVASHSSCRALSNLFRNMTDEMIAAVSRKGGVVQINFGCEFLSQKSWDVSRKYWAMGDAAKSKAEEEAIEAEARRVVPRATLADVVAHIDHVVKVAGVDAVGIGSDFDGVTCTPAGLDDVSKFPALTRALLEKGYSAGDIRKIYGGNLLRVMRAVEGVSAQKSRK